MSEIEDDFDDPALKAAVKRAARLGGDEIASSRAPASLRGAVKSLLAAELTAATAATGRTFDAAHPDADSPNPEPTPSAGRRFVIGRDVGRVAAVAACVLLALGWLAYQIRTEFFPPRRPALVASVPATYVQAIVRTHDNCARRGAHETAVPGGDPEAAPLREKLTAEARVAASTVSLGGDWQFKGAGLCQVDDRRAAHVSFVRRDDVVSIFSMPAPETCGYGEEWYRETRDSHPVAGFRSADALYCVVGSGTQSEFTMAELEPLLQKVKTSIASGCMSHQTIVAAAADSAMHDHP
jgi:hypothetical protein